MDSDYNRRLFQTSWLRRKYHSARFEWVSEVFSKASLNGDRVLELGCFDGRLLDYIPEPEYYVGIDGNWEGGLDLARKRFAGNTKKLLIESTTPESLRQFDSKSFTTCVSLETIEHILPELVDEYLQELARILRGDLLITVPNEKGPVLLAKKIAKRMISSPSEQYSWAELFNASIGRLHRVERNDHKGFDYAELVRQISKHFSIVSVSGLPVRFVPRLLSLTIAIHARSLKCELLT